MTNAIRVEFVVIDMLKGGQFFARGYPDRDSARRAAREAAAKAEGPACLAVAEVIEWLDVRPEPPAP